MSCGNKIYKRFSKNNDSENIASYDADPYDDPYSDDKEECFCGKLGNMDIKPSNNKSSIGLGIGPIMPNKDHVSVVKETFNSSRDDSDDVDFIYAQQYFPSPDLCWQDTVYNRYNDVICPGDKRLSDRMKWMGQKNKFAIDNRAKFDKYTNLNYFEEELNDAANSRWWDNDDLEQYM
jgi:hypothetical protein